MGIVISCFKNRILEKFNFENLIAWQKSVDFFDLVVIKTTTFNNQTGHFRLKEQLEAALASISMNIAEGAGRNSKKEFVNFLYYSRGSLYEVITLLILLNKRQLLSDEDLILLKEKSVELAKIINGLITSIKSNISY